MEDQWLKTPLEEGNFCLQVVQLGLERAGAFINGMSHIHKVLVDESWTANGGTKDSNPLSEAGGWLETR